MEHKLHYNEICAAVRGLVRGRVLLTLDPAGDTLTVGSNALFEPGQRVTLSDAEGARETHMVAARVGSAQVRLAEAVGGEFSVARGAWLELEPAPLGGVKWVGQGLPQIMPQPDAAQLPAVIVQPGRLEQPLAGGSNRSCAQEYHLLVYYLEAPAPGGVASVAVLERAAELFDLLMADPGLGGTAWDAQVVRLEPDPAAVRALQAAGREVVGVELELVARRWEER
jgi:hypothetical protein